MANNNGKSDLVRYGAGWTKEGKDGNQFISGVVDRELKVFLENKQGEKVEVDKILIFFNDKLDKEGNLHENWPDVRFCASVKE